MFRLISEYSNMKNPVSEDGNLPYAQNTTAAAVCQYIAVPDSGSNAYNFNLTFHLTHSSYGSYFANKSHPITRI